MKERPINRIAMTDYPTDIGGSEKHIARLVVVKI
jgi:hypothetical protein